MTDILKEIKSALPEVLQNEVLEYIHGPKGFATHKYKFAAVIRELNFYGNDEGYYNMRPEEIMEEEYGCLVALKRIYPTFWRQPSFIIHEYYMRSSLYEIMRRGAKERYNQNIAQIRQSQTFRNMLASLPYRTTLNRYNFG